MLTLNDIYQYVFKNRAIISTKKVQKLPANRRNQICLKIEDLIREKFASILAGPQNDSFRKLLRKLNNTRLEILLFNNATDEINISTMRFPSEAEIKLAFLTLENKYGYFKDDRINAECDFIRLFQACKLIADYVEYNNNDHDEAAALHAYKILVLFGCENGKNPFFSIQRFIRQFNFSTVSHPVHDVLIKDIPINDSIIDLSLWRQLIAKHGPKAISYFQIAPEINKYLNKNPSTFDEVKNTALKLRYQRYDEYIELAELCHLHHVTEELFNKCLETEPIRKKKDNLPDVVIDGNELGHPGYFLVKLPLNDPRVYIIGHITQCCMYVGGNAQRVIYDAITKESCGIYVLLKSNHAVNYGKPFLEKSNSASPPTINYKDFTIVGCGYTWLSKQGNLTFDSWENLRPESENPVIVAMLKRFGEIVTQQTNIERITIGVGGRTPKEFNISTHAEIMQAGAQHTDSFNQALIYIDKEKITSLPKLKIILLDQAEIQGLFSFFSKDIFNKLLDAISDSTAYLELVKKVFLDVEKHKIWEQCIGHNNEKQQTLVNNICISGIVMLDILLQCFQLDMLNEENYNLLITTQIKPIFILNSLASLKEAKIKTINPSLLMPLLELFIHNNWMYIEGTLLLLSEFDLLNDDIFAALIKDTEFARNIYQIGEFLIEARLLNKEHAQKLFEARKCFDKILTILKIHSCIGKLDKDNLGSIVDVVMKHENNINDLWLSLTLLHHSEYIDFEIFNIMVVLQKRNSIIIKYLIGTFVVDDLKKYLEKISALNGELFDDLRQGLTVLSEAKILDNEITKCFIRNSNIAKEIWFGLIRLLNMGVFNNEYKQLILDHPDQGTVIADSILRLKWDKLLNRNTNHIFHHNLKHINAISFALEHLYANSTRHRNKEIFANFINYYNSYDKGFNRTQLILDWTNNYIYENGINPFAVLKQQETTGHNPGLFKPVDDGIKPFESFLVGEEISSDLKSLMYGSQYVANIDMASPG